MMNELCLIPIEHLQEGKSVAISENFDPKFLEINDEDLSFSNPIEVNGKAYLAEDMLIIQLDMKGGASLPCSICNKKVAVPFFMKRLYYKTFDRHFCRKILLQRGAQRSNFT